VHPYSDGARPIAHTTGLRTSSSALLRGGGPRSQHASTVLPAPAGPSIRSSVPSPARAQSTRRAASPARVRAQAERPRKRTAPYGATPARRGHGQAKPGGKPSGILPCGSDGAAKTMAQMTNVSELNKLRAQLFIEAVLPSRTLSEQHPLRLNKRKESRGGSDVLTCHARPQTTCPAYTAPAPCRLQDRADATDAMVFLTPRRPAACACPLTGVAVPATEDCRPTARRRAGPPLRAVPDEPLADPAAPNSSHALTNSSSPREQELFRNRSGQNREESGKRLLTLGDAQTMTTDLHPLSRSPGAAAGRNWIGCRTRHERKGNNVTISLRGDVGRSLAAHLTALLLGQSSPFVTQSELRCLVKSDRSDIERQVRQAEWMMRHPRRGMSAAPGPLIGDWKRFLRWIDGAIQHLEQPRPVPDLEHLIRAWQDRRGNIVAPNLRWRRRADVIAV
jgi:hypothetical protein